MKLSTDFPIDKIAGYDIGSFTVPASSSSTPTILHGLTFKPLPTTTWSYNSNFSISYEESDPFSSGGSSKSTFQAQTDGTTTYFFIANNDTVSHTYYYRVLYYMPPDVDVDTPSTQTNFDAFVLNTDYNYPKILKFGKTIGNDETIPHDLGYYPQTDIWKVRSSDGRVMHHMSNESLAPYIQENALLTTSSLILSDPTTFVNYWYYKIYVDRV